jgi:F-type H+-transporting ATPase subunit gamma
MATLRDIRRRIGGVRKTQKITKAMKMVAAAKLRRAQQNVVAARPYADTMRQLMGTVSAGVDTAGMPVMAPREVKNAAVVVISSDRGLCGAFNSNLVRAAAQHIQALRAEGLDGDRVRVLGIGRRGHDFFSKRSYTMGKKHVGVYQGMTFARAQAITREIVEGYLRGDYDTVDLVYNEFKSVARQKPVVDRLIPIPRPAPSEGKPVTVDYIEEPSRDEILRALLPRHLAFQVWKALLESVAAEEAARMTAMENATRNASDLVSALQLQYNKARQAAITKELLEVVGGAEALASA